MVKQIVIFFKVRNRKGCLNWWSPHFLMMHTLAKIFEHVPIYVYLCIYKLYPCIAALIAYKQYKTVQN